MNNIIEQVIKLSKFRKSKIARRLGVSRARISQMMTTQGSLTLKTISEFCRCCGYAIDLKLTPLKPAKTANEIPTNLKWLFWDTDFNRLDPVLHRDYILSRILDRGTTDAVQWMREKYSRRQLLAHITKRRIKMSAKNINYWAFVFGKEEKWKPESAQTTATSWQGLPGVRA